MANNPRLPRRDGLDDPPSPSDETERDNEKSDLKKPSFWVSVITLLVIGGYTYFAHQQVTETQTANGIAKDALAEGACAVHATAQFQIGFGIGHLMHST